MAPNSELDYFTRLGHSKAPIRYKSGRMILSSIRKDQSLEKLLYTLKRLITGLGGTKLRAGCFATLSSLIESMTEHIIDFDTYNTLIRNCLSPTKGDSKKERGDAFLGEILAYAALIHSDYLSLESSEVHDAIALRLTDIAKKKSYLHHPSIIHLTKLCQKYEPRIHDTFLNHLLNLEEHTLDKLYYIINLSSNNKAEIVNAVFGDDSSDIMEINVVKRIANLILDRSTDSSMDHPFFDLFSKMLSLQDDMLKCYWETLTTKSEACQKKKANIIFRLMAYLVAHINNAALLVDVMNVSAVRILNQKGKKDPIAKKIVYKIVELSKNADGTTQRRMITTILFDQVSFKSKKGVQIVDQLIGCLKFEDIKIISKKLVNLMKGTLAKISDEPWTEKEKTEIFKYYSKFLLHAATRRKKNWRCKQLKNIVDMSLFTTHISQINMQLSGVIKDFFFNAIGHASNNIVSHRDILANLVGYIRNEITSGCTLRKQLSPELYEKWTESAGYFLTSYESAVVPEMNEIYVVLQLLAFYMLLDTFRDPKHSIDELEDMSKIYKFALSQNEQGESSEVHWSEFFLEKLMHLLSVPVSGYRVIVASLFKSAVKYLTEDAIYNLIDILNTEEQEKTEIEESDSEVEESDSEVEESDSEVEESDSEVEESDSEVEESDNEGSNNECDDNSGSDSDEKSISLFHNQSKESSSNDVHTGHLSPFTQDDNASIDLDNVNEEEVNRLNIFLGEILKKQKVKSTKNKLTQSGLTHYRIRVLDLIEICCKKTQYVTLKFWIDIINVLIKLYKVTSRTETKAPLHHKIGSCMIKISTVRFEKYGEGNLVEHSSEITMLVNDLLDEAEKGLSAQYRNNLLTLSKPFIKLCKVCNGDARESLYPITAIVTKYFKEFFTARSKIPVCYFMSLCDVNWKGLNTLTNLASIFMFDHNIRISKRIIAIKFIEKFFTCDRNFEEFADVIHTFEETFCKYTEDSDSSNKPEHYENYIKELETLVKMLQKKGRDKLFKKWSKIIKACENVTDQFRKKSPPSPEVISQKVSQKPTEEISSRSRKSNRSLQEPTEGLLGEVSRSKYKKKRRRVQQLPPSEQMVEVPEYTQNQPSTSNEEGLLKEGFDFRKRKTLSEQSLCQEMQETEQPKKRTKSSIPVDRQPLTSRGLFQRNTDLKTKKKSSKFLRKQSNLRRMEAMNLDCEITNFSILSKTVE